MGITCSCGAKLTMPAEYSAQIDLVKSLNEIFIEAHLPCRQQHVKTADALEDIADTLRGFLDIAHGEFEK